MIHADISLDQFNHMKGISTKYFTYDTKNKIFSIEMSELGFINGEDFLIPGKLCRANGQLNLNDKNHYGSIILTSHRTGIRAFFTFESVNMDKDKNLLGVFYRYFAADNDPQGHNPIMKQCKILAIND